MKTLKKILLPAALIIAGIFNCRAQDATSPEAIALKKIADSKTFIFKAINANLVGDQGSTNGSYVNTNQSSSAGHFHLTGEYSVICTPDSMVVYLPIFGNNTIEDKPDMAYQTVTVNENPVKYVFTHYSYVVQQKKKGNVQITAKPDDTKQVEKMVFDIGIDGKVKLSFSLADRNNSISYDGDLIK